MKMYKAVDRSDFVGPFCVIVHRRLTRVAAQGSDEDGDLFEELHFVDHVATKEEAADLEEKLGAIECRRFPPREIRGFVCDRAARDKRKAAS